MRLTQKRERPAVWWVRPGGEALRSAPDGAIEQHAEWNQARIRRELKAFIAASRLRDPQPIGASQRYVPPAEQSGIARVSNRPLVLNVRDRVWLGVCGGLGEYLDVEPRYVRFAAIVLGLMTWPLVPIAYLVLYFEMYAATRRTGLRDRVPRIDGVELLQVAGGTMMAVAALGLTARLILALLDSASSWLAVQPALDLGAWEWVRLNRTWMIYAALFAFAPAAVLAGLPVAGDWKATGKKVLSAAVAVYALALCFGIASSLVAVILQAIARFSIG